MTLTQNQKRMIPQLKTELTYSKVEHLLSQYYEDQLAKEVSKIFQEMEYRVINNLAEYYNPEVMFKAHTDLILAPIHEMHKDYYELLCKYKIREFDKSRASGKRIVERLINFRRRGNILNRKYTVLKADLNDAVSSTITKDKLFGTSPDVHENLETRTYQLSEKTLARVDGQINDIIVNGYEEGMGIDKVSRDIRRRFGQLKTWESVRIARTEIHNSQCLGVIKGYDDMGVEYIQWSTARDSRVRGLKPKDSADHIHMEGEIIRMGGVFSNGLMYPGDMAGPAAEIINCRCQALPFIIPYGYIAPPDMAQFREDDLIATLDYFNADGVIERAMRDTKPIIEMKDNIDKAMDEVLRVSNEWNINRLFSGEKKVYLRAKHDYLLLKDAIETGDYSKLNRLKNKGYSEIYDRDSFMKLTKNGKDLEIAEMDLEDYKMDIDFYENIIKDTNIEVSIKPQRINWGEGSNISRYHNLTKDGDYVEMNLDEQFVKYHYKDENLTIYESTDMDFSRVRHVYSAYKKMPPHMKNVKEIVLSSQNPVQKGLFSDSKLGGYVLNKKGNTRIYQFKRSVNDTELILFHESAHLLERDSDWFISNSKEYIQAFKRDQKRLLSKGYTLEETYITPYSRSFTQNAINNNSKIRPYSEDFAESVKFYLKDKDTFTKMYPEKAKVIEKAIQGKLTRKNTINYFTWKKQELVKYDLTEKETERYMELDLLTKPYISNHRKLTKSEQKEFQYYNDKKTFSYIYKKIVNDDDLSDKEVEEFMRLQAKYKF